MKLAIYTPIHENYGAHDWDGRGECPQYWKAKGGDVYVVEDLTVEQCLKIGKSGIPHLTNLIECSDDYIREEVMEWMILDDCEIECEDWETPIVLKYDRIAECWMATRIVQRDDCWKEGIDYKMEGWVLAPGAERKHYTETYYGWAA